MSERKVLTVEQYEELFAETYGDEIEFEDGEMLIGGQPFFEFAVRYLELLGCEVLV